MFGIDSCADRLPDREIQESGTIVAPNGLELPGTAVAPEVSGLRKDAGSLIGIWFGSE